MEEKKPKKKLKYVMRGMIVLLLVYVGWIMLTIPDVKKLPPLKNGDLVFQTTVDVQSWAVIFASHSPFTHMGMIKLGKNGPVVVEAVGPVKETPLQDWLVREFAMRAAIKRMKGLSERDALAALAAAKKEYGKPYDIYFLPDDKAYYCSELVHDSFDRAGVALGKEEKVGELGQSMAMDEIIERRWQSYPPCRKPGMTLEKCRKIIMEQPLVTPASIARDERMETIWSNYPFD